MRVRRLACLAGPFLTALAALALERLDTRLLPSRAAIDASPCARAPARAGARGPA